MALLRALAFLAALLVALPLAALIALALVAHVTLWGLAYLAGCALLVAPALAGPFRAARRLPFARAGLALIALVALARIAFAASGPHATMYTLPDAHASRWLARLIDEQDLAMLGAVVCPRVGAIPAREGAALAPAMLHGYEAMRASEGTLPSPVLDTYTARESPDAFDAIVIEPDGPARFGVVFLHGFAGNFTMPCWVFAQAVRPLGAVTVCPSTRWLGDWQSRAGEATARASVRWLHARGVARVYLAGLSAGGVGASLLAPRMAHELRGLVLISGASSGGGTGGLPTLVVHGASDPMASIGPARALAARAGGRATMVVVPGGHFVLIERLDEVRAAIARWFAAREGVTP